MNHWYSDLKERFLSFESNLQMLNLVSDLIKAKNMAGINQQDSIDNCLRAIILLDYIIADSKWKSRRKELFRLREVLGSLTTANPMATWDQAINAALLTDAGAYRLYHSI